MKYLLRLAAISLLGSILFAACTPANQPYKISYSLRSSVEDGKLVFIGVGGDIDGQVDPTLLAKVGDIVTISLVDGDDSEQNVSIPDLDVESAPVAGNGQKITLTFNAYKAGSFPYLSRLPGDAEARVQGMLVVNGPVTGPATPAAEPQASMSMPTPTPGKQAAANTGSQAPTTGADIVRDPTDLPGPIGNRGPTTVHIDLEAKEVVGQLADGTTYPYWTFNGKVPGPFFRVLVGDTVELHLKNDANSMLPHSVDFHAATGPGGGAIMTTAQPGAETTFKFKALQPGLYVYHCAVPMAAMHIASGMYGMILVEPPGGLPPVDREFYVMQGEIYTTGKFGDKGLQAADMQKLLDEQPEYFVFNGAVGALTTRMPLKASVGQTIRIFFGVGGPNYTSSFHIIGEILDRVYNLGSITTPPMTEVQTTVVPPGGATIVELKLLVPGKYVLVDHALVRVERGLSGWLIVDGPPAPDIYSGTPQPGSGH